jgi:hypothetical protein
MWPDMEAQVFIEGGVGIVPDESVSRSIAQIECAM